MSILTACCIALASSYALLMLVYGQGWKKEPLFQMAEDFQPRTKLSVVIPARNEAANIGACLDSILKQNYPEALLEIIVVDDHSEDETAAIAKAFGQNRVQVISLKDRLPDMQTMAFKKKALAAGIAAGRGELIVTTDADCSAPPSWLRHIAALYERQNPVMIIGPVAFLQKRGLLYRFQSLDFTTMQGITAASHRLRLGGMANGANLSFSREAFNDVGGYSGTEHLASGDDYLLLHKMEQRFPDRIHYLKSADAIVRTAAQPTWGAFLNQRIRWASKSGKYSDHRLTAILALVYSFNVSILVLAIAAFRNPQLWILMAAAVLMKILSELLLLLPVARFFQKQRELLFFPLLQPLHIFYIILAGFLGMRGGYRWKGRKVKQALTFTLMGKVISLVVLLLVLLIGGFIYWNYYNAYSDGTREGMVQKFSRKGSLFKTWEGEMQQQGFGQRGGGNFSSKVFYFSVTNEAVADSLEHGAQGKIVRLHYVQYRRSLSWRGDNYNGRNEDPGQYVVDRIEEVRPLQY